MIKKIDKEMIYVVLLIVYQSSLYFICKLTPFKSHLLISSMDSKIPLIPIFIYFYVSWYIMLILVPYLILKSNKVGFKKYIYSNIIAITLSAFIYVFFPTTILRSNIEINSLSTFILNFIYFTDTPPLDCLPSMHCMICFFSIYYSSKYLTQKNKIIITVWSVFVILSTLFTKQHVLIDVLVAFIMSIPIYILVDKKIKN